MAPISKKVGPGPAGKAGGNLISKTPAGKSNSAMKFGSKQNNSSSLAAKTSASSFGDKKASSSNFGGSNASTSTISSGKNNSSNFSSTSNFGNKLGGASNDGKPSTASSFGGLGGNAKSSKISSDPFKTVTDKSYASSYMGPKNRKSSVKFGIIWLPTRKRNKMKDTVYNPYDTDKRDLFKERTPSMYNL